MGVGEARRRLDFPEESLGAERRGDLGPKDLDGDEATVAEIAREIHRRHPAAPQLALQRVAVGQGGFQAGELIGHVGQLLVSDQPLEPRIPPQGRIEGVHAQQWNRERRRDRQQVLELVERGLVLPGPYIDLNQVEQHSGSG